MDGRWKSTAKLILKRGAGRFWRFPKHDGRSDSIFELNGYLVRDPVGRCTLEGAFCEV